jgi:hypothetical protein
LADQRHLDAAGVRRLGVEARDLLARWTEAGWCTVDGMDSRRNA